MQNTIKIGGINYNVKRVKECLCDDKQVDAQIVFKDCNIEIREDVKDDYYKLVLLHETLHGIYEHCGFEQDENLIERMSTAIFMVLQDNKQLFKEVYYGKS